MGRRNTMERWPYRLELLFWAGFAMLWYRAILFRPVLELSNRQSRLLLWGLVAAGVLGGYAATCRTRRNGFNLLVTVLLPFELYSLLAYGRYFPTLVRAALCAALLLSIGYSLWVLLSPIRRPERRRAILLRRGVESLMGGRAILALCTAVVLAAVVRTALQGGVFLVPDRKAQDGGQPQQDTIAGHMEELRQLEAERWAELTLEERLNVLQTVANIERTYLGVPHELFVGAGMLDEGTVGCYNPVTNQIALSLDHLAEDDVEEVLDTVLHECYHAYQRSLVELYGQSPERYRDLQIFSAAQDYAEEMADYQDGTDFSAYYSQRCEQDARRYAEAGVQDYYERLACGPEADGP